MKLELISLAARVSAAAVLLATAGCAGDPEPRVRVDPVVAHQVLASAAAQVRRCYRSPRISSAGRRIVTRVAVRFNADGTLAQLPMLIAQSGVTEGNGAEAPRMAEAASLAIIRCAPLRLPPEHYGRIWHSFELTFSPALKA